MPESIMLCLIVRMTLASSFLREDEIYQDDITALIFGRKQHLARYPIILTTLRLPPQPVPLDQSGLPGASDRPSPFGESCGGLPGQPGRAPSLRRGSIAALCALILKGILRRNSR